MNQEHGEVHNLLEQINEDEDEDELIEIQLQKSTIKVNYVNLLTYSKFVRNEYQNLTETKLRLPKEFQTFQNKFNICDENSILFFSTFKNKNFYINNQNYWDLYKLSNFFQVKRLIILLNQYKDNHKFDIDLIISEMLKEIQNQANENYNIDELSFDLESILYKKVNECLKNERFELLPISIVYRILSKSEEEISSDLLFDFISKSIEERYTLLTFLTIQNLNDSKYDELIDLYDQNQIYFQYLPSNVSYLKSIKNENKKLKNENEIIKSENKKIKNENERIKDENEKIKTKLREMDKKCVKLQGHIDDVFHTIDFFMGMQKDADFSDIFAYINSCAEKGNVFALLCVGLVCYFFGENDDEIKNKSKLCFEELHKQGIFHELLIIALIYENEKEDYPKAIDFYQQSAEKGNQGAILKLASFYENGKGVEKNIPKAIELYEKLAQDGNSTALIRLSNLYREGNGVEQNYSIAIEYLKQSEERGNIAALGYLAEIYEEGKIVKKNLSIALNYYEKMNNLFHFPIMNHKIKCIKSELSDGNKHDESEIIDKSGIGESVDKIEKQQKSTPQTQENHEEPKKLNIEKKQPEIRKQTIDPNLEDRIEQQPDLKLQSQIKDDMDQSNDDNSDSDPHVKKSIKIPKKKKRIIPNRKITEESPK